MSILDTLKPCPPQPASLIWRLKLTSLHNTPLMLTSTQYIAVDLQANAEPAADKLATPIEEKAKQVGDAAVPTADAASEDLKNVAASVGQVCAADKRLPWCGIHVGVFARTAAGTDRVQNGVLDCGTAACGHIAMLECGQPERCLNARRAKKFCLQPRSRRPH